MRTISTTIVQTTNNKAAVSEYFRRRELVNHRADDARQRLLQPVLWLGR